MVAVAEPDKLMTYLLEMLVPLGPMSARRMFGGIGLFHRGTMFGLIAREELYFKVGDGNRRDYEAAGEAAFSYETRNGRNTIHSYWRCPPDILDETDKFQAWARAAIDAAGAAAKSKPGSGGTARRRTPRGPNATEKR